MATSGRCYVAWPGPNGTPLAHQVPKPKSPIANSPRQPGLRFPSPVFGSTFRVPKLARFPSPVFGSTPGVPKLARPGTSPSLRGLSLSQPGERQSQAWQTNGGTWAAVCHPQFLFPTCAFRSSSSFRCREQNNRHTPCSAATALSHTDSYFCHDDVDCFFSIRHGKRAFSSPRPKPVSSSSASSSVLSPTSSSSVLSLFTSSPLSSSPSPRSAFSSPSSRFASAFPLSSSPPAHLPSSPHSLNRPAFSRLLCSASSADGMLTSSTDGTPTSSTGSTPAEYPTTEPGENPSVRIPSAYTLLKFSLALFLALAILQGSLNLLVSACLAVLPPVLTYGGMALVCWPWLFALALGVATLALAARQGRAAPPAPSTEAGGQVETSGRKSILSLLQQLIVLAGSLTWLILVPCAHFQGFLGSWPILLFSVYVLFFAESAFIRGWLYGDLARRSDDKQWASPVSRVAQILFIVALVSGHWLAARESPLLAMAVAGQSGAHNLPALVLLFFALWLHWDAALMLGKSFDRLVPPEAVVTTGPYRWVRHPIYSSYMLLFAGYCTGLRSYRSLAFILAVCLWYYSHRTKLEEEQLLEHFGDGYGRYRGKVDKKFLPFVF